MLYRSCTSLPLSLKNKNISLWNFSINLNGASFLISPFTFTVYSRIHYIKWQTVARCTKERCKWLTKYIFYTKGSKVKRCYSRVSLLLFNSSFPTGEKTKKKRRHRKSPWININDPRYWRIFVTKRNEFLIQQITRYFCIACGCALRFTFCLHGRGKSEGAVRDAYSSSGWLDDGAVEMRP